MKNPDDFNSFLHDWKDRLQMTRIQYNGMDFDGCMELVHRIGKMLYPGFIIDDDNRGVYENLVRWVNGDSSAQCLTPDGGFRKADLTKGVYIAGPTGTGKTVCLNVLNIYARTVGIQYRTCGAVKQMGWVSNRSDAICEKYAKEGDLRTFKAEDVLCINDLCAEETETLYMGNRQNVMRAILEARGDSTGKITLVTSNKPIERLGKYYGDRVLSRSYEMFNYYLLRGNDRRKS